MKRREFIRLLGGATLAWPLAARAPSRYLIFLMPRLDRLISRLHRLTDQSQLPAILAEFDTVLVEERAN